jgi:hypothetical protein
MATIKDLASAGLGGPETITIGGEPISIRPVRSFELLRIIGRFPALKKVFFGADAITMIDVLVDAGPDAIAAVLACATGRPGDAKEEAAISALPDEDIIALLGATMKATMPEGIEAFFDRFSKLAAASGLMRQSPGGSAEAG